MNVCIVGSGHVGLVTGACLAELGNSVVCMDNDVSKIDRKQYSVWVDQHDVSEVADRVAAFHQALSPQDFHDLKIPCRKLWENWLCPEGFFANFYRHF